MLPRVSSQYRANSRGSLMIESTASNASLDGIELPGDLEHLFTHVGIHFAGAILTTLGVAIGKGAVLRTNLLPTLVNTGLAFAICAQQNDWIEDACQVFLQPLRDEGDRKLSRVGEGAKDILEQIRRIEGERRAFFGADIVRDDKVEGLFRFKIETLRSLLHSAMVTENPRPGGINAAVNKNGGVGLLTYFNNGWFSRELEGVKKDSRNLEILTQSWQGKTPEMNYSNCHNERPIVRPVVGVLITCTPETVTRLVCSENLTVREFAAQLILARAPNSEGFVGADIGQLPGFWASRIDQFVTWRDSGARRQLTVSRGGAAALSTYAHEVGRNGSKQRCWLLKAPITAAKISILLHVWSGSTADEITEKTMRAAIRLTRALANESSAVACAFAAGDEYRQIREAGEEMLENALRAAPPRLPSSQAAQSPSPPLTESSRLTNWSIHCGFSGSIRPSAITERVAA
jgi:hypothetical protein